MGQTKQNLISRDDAILDYHSTAMGIIEKALKKVADEKDYEVNIKSHTEAPDYEDTIRASSKEEAAEKFAISIQKRGGDWTAGDLIEFVVEK